LKTTPDVGLKHNLLQTRKIQNTLNRPKDLRLTSPVDERMQRNMGGVCAPTHGSDEDDFLCMNKYGKFTLIVLVYLCLSLSIVVVDMFCNSLSNRLLKTVTYNLSSGGNTDMCQAVL
jgi:hypothetical protein